MLILTNTGTDKLQVVTGTANTIDVHASWTDLASGTVTPGRTNTAITTATTTDIVATPAASTVRNVKTINIRNKSASACDITVVFDQNGTDFELHKVNLQAGECLEYVEGVGWFVVGSVKLFAKLRVAADVTNATTSFADITGLTCPVVSGRHYNFNAHIVHRTDATTTGARFGIGGVAMTGMLLNGIQQITASVTAATFGASAAVTAVDTAAVVETTGPGNNNFLAILTGWFNPSASGTFAFRFQSEVAVANALVVEAGSWAQVWEADN